MAKVFVIHKRTLFIYWRTRRDFPCDSLDRYNSVSFSFTCVINSDSIAKLSIYIA